MPDVLTAAIIHQSKYPDTGFASRWPLGRRQHRDLEVRPDWPARNPQHYRHGPGGAVGGGRPVE